MSTLMDRIGLAITKKQTTARGQYLASLRAGDAEGIAAAASAAGISSEQLQSDAGVLERAAELAEKVADLPAAEKALDGVQAVARAIAERKRKFLEEIALEEKEIGVDLYQSGKAASEARAAANTLYSDFKNYPELLPLETAPAVVRERFQNEAKQSQVTALGVERQRRLLKAQQRLDQLEAALHRAMYKPSIFEPAGIRNGMFDPNQVQAGHNAVLAEIETALPSARHELAEARAAAGVGENEL